MNESSFAKDQQPGFLKVMLIWLLAGLTMLPRMALANPYMDHAVQVVAAERTLAKEVAKKKVADGLLVLASYHFGIIGNVNALTASFTQQNARLGGLVADVKSLLAESSMDNYQKLLRKQLEHREASADALAPVRDIRTGIAATAGRVNDFDHFCDQAVAKIDVENLRANPLGSFAGVKALYHDYGSLLRGGAGRNIFSEDPRANMVGILALPVSVFIGIMAYMLASGLTVSAVATMFTASLANNSVTVGGTGPGAVILMAAVFVAIVVSDWYTTEENKKAAKKAEEKFQQEIADFSAAKAWYDAQTIKTEEWQGMVREVCSSPEVQKEMERKKAALVDAVATLRDRDTSLAGAEAKIKTESSNIDSIMVSYRDTLQKSVTAGYLAETNKKIMSESSVDSAVLIYNEQVKPEAEKMFTYYAKNRTDCSALQNYYGEEEALLDLRLQSMTAFKDELNANDPFFEQAHHGASTVLDGFKAKVKRCFDAVGTTVPEVPPVYDY